MKGALAVAVLVALAAVSLGAALVSDGGGPDIDHSAAPTTTLPIPTRMPTPDRGPTFGATNFATIPYALIDGRLVAASPDSVTVSTASGTSTYPLDAWTQICRRSCSEQWSALEVGSRVDGVVDFLTTGPHARWLNVNSWSDWAQVDAVDGDRLTLHTTRATPQVNGPYTLVIGPATRVDPPGELRVGEKVHITGSTQGPDDRSVVFGLLVSRSTPRP